MLTVVHGGGKLHHLAARAWKALVAAGWAEVGLPLTFTYGGTYRSYQAQETLFRSRYDQTGKTTVCKTWNGQRWCKKSAGLATAATPGTSNHGWGLAIDTAWDRDLSDGIGPDDAAYIESHPGWQWLLANAARFGFSWELQSEPWHLRYVAGDAVPAAVLAFEAPPAPLTPDPQPEPEDDDMAMIAYFAKPPADLPGNPPWLLCVDGAVRYATNVDTDRLTPLGVEVIEVNAEQYPNLLRSAGLG